MIVGPIEEGIPLPAHGRVGPISKRLLECPVGASFTITGTTALETVRNYAWRHKILIVTRMEGENVWRVWRKA